MKKLSILALGVLASATATAMHTPLSESLRYIEAVANSEAVYNEIGSTRIVAGINRIMDNRYVVTASGACQLTVDVSPVNSEAMVPELVVSVVDGGCD